MLYGEKTMEVELKFLIEDKLAQERILKDRHLAEIKDEDVYKRQDESRQFNERSAYAAGNHFEDGYKMTDYFFGK